jgi:DNA primase
MPPPSKWIDFRAIRQNVTMESALHHYGVQLRRTDPNTLRGKCPLPSHSSKSFYSFIVDTGKNLWACHSDSCAAARDGRRGGNVLDFVTTMEKCSLREAALKVAGWFGVPAAGPPSQPRTVSKEEQQPNPPLRFRLQGIDPTHPYLANRGIAAETAAAFGIGFYSQPGTMTGRLVIPVHNPEGKLVAYAGRAIDNSEPKYRFPKGFKKSLELFNLHRVSAMPRRNVIVVEGFFDCITLYQAGFQNVVALMGSTLTEPQEKLLVHHFDAATLMLDGDKPGQKATERIAAQLAGKIDMKVMHVPDGKQPDQMSPAELRGLLGDARRAGTSSRVQGPLREITNRVQSSPGPKHRV